MPWLLTKMCGMPWLLTKINLFADCRMYHTVDQFHTPSWK
jgi:hypothetical protein